MKGPGDTLRRAQSAVVPLHFSDAVRIAVEISLHQSVRSDDGSAPSSPTPGPARLTAKWLRLVLPAAEERVRREWCARCSLKSLVDGCARRSPLRVRPTQAGSRPAVA
jgi:hypothetical protein